MRMHTKIAAGILAIATCVSLAGCGTKDTDNADTAEKSATKFSVDSIAKDDKIAAMVPEAVVKTGKLTAGLDTSYAPAEFLASDGKTIQGYDADLVRAIAKIFGLTAEPQTANFDSIIPSVGSKYDLGVSSFTITPEREKAVDFVSYFKAGMTYVVKKGNPENVDIKNLCGVKAAVQTGTTEEDELNKANAQCKADGKPAIVIQSYGLQTDVTTAVVTGKAAVFYADSPVAGYAIEQTHGQLEQLGKDVGVAEQGIAIKKGDTQLAKAVSAAINKLMKDGSYAKILETWGAQSGAISESKVVGE